MGGFGYFEVGVVEVELGLGILCSREFEVAAVKLGRGHLEERLVLNLMFSHEVCIEEGEIL